MMYFSITSMPTKKKRINVSLNKDAVIFLKHLALRDDVPEATKAAQLIEIAMVLDEDMEDARIADEVLKKSKGKTISHDAFWSKLL